MVTKEQCMALIERLADNTHYYYTCEKCQVNVLCSSCGSSGQRHPIMLTDVLEKMKEESKLNRFYNNVCSCWKDDCACPSGKTVDHQTELLELWHNCGITKSLQNILNDAEWEDIGHHTHNMRDCRQCANKPMIGSAADLFRFLSSLFPET